MSLTETVTPLDEESDVAPLDKEELRRNLRNFVIAGGRPYILLKVIDPETGATELDAYGVEPARIPEALREIADLVEADLADAE